MSKKKKEKPKDDDRVMVQCAECFDRYNIKSNDVCPVCGADAIVGATMNGTFKVWHKANEVKL